LNRQDFDDEAFSFRRRGNFPARHSQNPQQSAEEQNDDYEAYPTGDGQRRIDHIHDIKIAEDEEINAELALSKQLQTDEESAEARISADEPERPFRQEQYREPIVELLPKNQTENVEIKPEGSFFWVCDLSPNASLPNTGSLTMN